MLPACKSGNTKTFAFPATLLFGAFRSATFLTIAASNCNSPSISKSGLISLANSVAFLTLSTKSCCALPIVENDNIATLGSIPQRVFAVSAVLIAIDANSSAVGHGFTAQSAKRSNPFSPYSQLGTSITNVLETTDIPGAVLTI